MFLGVIFLVAGIVLILKALGFFSMVSWSLFWGIVFLILGLKMISKKDKKHCMHCDWFGYKHDKE
ncbi:MAG: hypothetical protein A3C58_00875 [Candidatus Staskawiczbacteria bacterium RIFCSPHIGHO2_02_FULL_34_10]|uniref:LiaF transmembrane domain-containing protein n=1 Tax=Candidatus Staskawiczbacteria bacterium RIFCSPHIGHO2_02_FULL_34_10 TaxID=1802205 RepID=A0A1G2HW62_9BACT|nr:MAG: hypothetical protein A3C58_00875 [Candidatus Staskawiczbacteria bacterium RIFCSPHIGHO2_02_FULL_34_10]